MLTDDQILSLQTIIMNWIKHEGNIEFFRARKTIENAALSLSIDITNFPNAEYRIIYPLYQVGILEYGRTSKGLRLFPCSSELILFDGRWYYSPEFILPRYKREFFACQSPIPSGEAYFNAIPSLKSCILNWRKQNVVNLRVSYDLEKHSFLYKDEPIADFGIYKQANEAWIDSYFRIDSVDYLIPRYSENPEAFRIAKSYAMIVNGIKLFEYSNQRLKCLHYIDLPIPIIRGLLISAPENLSNENIYHYESQMEFENIPNNIIRQLERVFSISL